MRTMKLLHSAVLFIGLLTSAFADPIHEAAWMGGFDMVRQLLDGGADINKRDKLGMTSLMHAANYGRTDIVKMLLVRGANVGLRTPSSEIDALGFARYCGHKQKRTDTVDLIEKYKANPQGWLISQLKNSPIDQLLGKFELDKGEYVEALTDAIITAKNKQLPDFLATATSPQKVDMLTAVEKQLARATARIDRLNGEAADAIVKKQDAAPYRARVGQIKAYINVLNEIKAILEQS